MVGRVLFTRLMQIQICPCWGGLSTGKMVPLVGCVDGSAQIMVAVPSTLVEATQLSFSHMARGPPELLPLCEDPG